MKRKGGLKAQAQWWLGLGLTLALIYLGWALVARPSSYPQPELPAYPCPGKSDTYEAEGVEVTYRSSGCARLSSDQAIAAAHTYRDLDGSLQALRLPPLPRGLRIGLYPAKSSGYELLGRPGGPRAIAIRTASRQSPLQVQMAALRALADLDLQEAAPALDERSRRALAGALAAIAAEGRDLDRMIALTMSADERRALRLLAGHGPFYLADTLERRCRARCSWRPLG